MSEPVIISKTQFEFMSMLQRAAWIHGLLAGNKVTQTSLAQGLGISRRQVGRYFNLHKAPEQIQKQINSGLLEITYLDGMSSSLASPAPAAELLDQAGEDLGDGIPDGPQPLPTKETVSKAQSLAEFHAGALPSFFRTPAPGFRPSSGYCDRVFQAYQKWIEYYDVPPTEPPPPAGKEVHIAVINDLHAPFHCNESFRTFVQREKGWADVVVVAGDLLDLFSWSSFSKRQQAYAPTEEFMIGQSLVNTLAANFKQVILLGGNHDDRMYRHLLRNNIEGGNLDFLQLMLRSQGATLDVLQAMSHQLENVQLAEPARMDLAEHGYFHQIGDLIVGHPETYSLIPGRAVENFIKWLRVTAQTTGLVKDFKVVGMGHTHSYCQIRAFGAWGYEMGCMCPYQEYTSNPKIKTKREWNKGYMKFVQVGGVTDINRSGFVCLDDEFPVAVKKAA